MHILIMFIFARISTIIKDYGNKIQIYLILKRFKNKLFQVEVNIVKPKISQVKT